MQLAEIKKIGVVGGGTMGFGIAINFALWGYPVVMSDLNDEVLTHSMRQIALAMDLFVEGGLINRQRAEETLGRIHTTTDLAELVVGCDFITEAIVERLSDKQALFKQLDTLCPSHTILARKSMTIRKTCGWSCQRLARL